MVYPREVTNGLMSRSRPHSDAPGSLSGWVRQPWRPTVDWSIRIVTTALVRPELWYAWKGLSLLIVNTRGACGHDQPLSGYYYREARFVQTFRLEINGQEPWLCEAASLEPDTLSFTFIYPELTTFGGGGTGQSGDDESTGPQGVPHRALVIQATYVVGLRGLDVSLTLTNHARRLVTCTLGWIVDTDFADIQEAQAGKRQQDGEIVRQRDDTGLTFTYLHPQLPYRTRITATGPGEWNRDASNIITRAQLHAQQSADFVIRIEPGDAASPPLQDEDVERRERHSRAWRAGLTRVTIPANLVAEQLVAKNVRDLCSFPLLDGEPDEWLTLQAGMPLYPALFGRDTLTAGWQAAYLDRATSLDASLTCLGRMQSDRVYAWRDEEPGRIPYQVRRGPLARLNLNPYSAYYADYASPFMFVISLAHLYAWTGERAALQRHWDVARRILDWARRDGDKDGDGYLEYHTQSSHGTKNQGWKDSGDAIVYDDGTPVPAPIATCEVQGYWFAAQQLMAVMSWALGAHDDARAHWRSAMDLKARFNRDWWMEDDASIALALDPDKRTVRAVTSNIGHCVACGIIDDDHLPPAVGRLFAPDMFSGWGIRTLSSSHASYDPLSYHRGTVWAVEQATIAFGLRRFGFDARALELARALFDLAQLYPEYRIPECVGGFSRGERGTPGAYPRANTPQLWNASAFPLLIHTIAGLQPVAPLELLVIAPALPAWLPEIVLHDLRLGGATATLRFWREADGTSHGEILRKRGTLRLVKQPPPESLTAGVGDRLSALFDSLIH